MDKLKMQTANKADEISEVSGDVPEHTWGS